MGYAPSPNVATFLSLALLICALSADAFAASGRNTLAAAATGARRQWPSFLGKSIRTSAAPSSLKASHESSITVTSTPPSWDDLSAELQAADTAEPPKKPLVTLYRDTNGWCPFCERVWVILRAKGIPYDEQLISLQNKPDWYKALVPTTLVPAILFHGEEGKNERRIVWESSDILAALDEEFPETPQMEFDTPEYKAAVEMNDDLTAAGFGFVYAGRNDTLTEEDKLDRRKKFIAELDRLNDALQAHHTDGGEGGFRLGKDFTAVDALMIPTLERWRYQLPITTDIDILEGRPALKAWFEAMDTFEPYANRVAGDEYSWTATNSMFLRFFGGGEDKPDVAAAIKRADNAAESLSSLFAENAVKEEDGEYSKEAAAKLVTNHEAVIKDCTRDDPKSQQHIGRASSSDAADAMLRYVASLLLSNNDTVLQAKEASLLGVENKESAKDAATAARTVASRLCVPRDMSAPAASILRAALVIVADRLEE